MSQHIMQTVHSRDALAHIVLSKGTGIAAARRPEIVPHRSNRVPRAEVHPPAPLTTPPAAPQTLGAQPEPMLNYENVLEPRGPCARARKFKLFRSPRNRPTPFKPGSGRPLASIRPPANIGTAGECPRRSRHDETVYNRAIA